MPSRNPVFRLDETHARVLRAGNELIAHSEDAAWRSLYAAIIREAPLDATEPALPHPSLIYHLTSPTEVTRRIEGGAAETRTNLPRNVCITPGGLPTYWRHSGNPEILQVYLRQSVYETAVNELFGCSAEMATLVPALSAADPLLEQLLVSINQALRDRTSEDGLYIDTLAHTIAVHLAHRHSTRAKSSRISVLQPIIGSYRLRRVIEFIEDHLDHDLTLETIAAQSGLSAIYMGRVFRNAFGLSPHQYVLSRRVERAKQLLRESDFSIAEVAAAAGFSSQSHLSYWFSRRVGVSPGSYRRRE
jgi:AraC family transcriptional regulator